MNSPEQIYKLVEQWSHALDASKANEALRQIAIITRCIPQVPNQLTEQDNKCVVRWLQENHPTAYLWAMSQRSIGHPAMIWGAKINQKGTSSV